MNINNSLVPLAVSHDLYWMIDAGAGNQLLAQLKATDAARHRQDFEARIPAGVPALAARASGSSYGRTEEKPYEMTKGGTAILSIVGPMTKAPTSWDSGCSTVYTRRLVRAAMNDDDVKKIVIRFDSPGGSVSGTADLADDISAAARVKPVIGFVEDCCCSAAYWCASQCSEIYANRTSIIGSIGTVMVMYDWSTWMENEGGEALVFSTGSMKGAGAFGSKITEEHRAEFQAIVDNLNAHFLQGISKGRDLSSAKAKELATGSVWIGEQAVQLGLIDGIKTFDEVVSSPDKSARRQGAAAESFSQEDGLPIGLSLEDALKSVLTAVEGATSGVSSVANRVEAIRSLRESQNRKFSEERLEQVKAIANQVDGLADTLSALVTACESLSSPAEQNAEASPTAEQSDQDLAALDEALLSAALLSAALTLNS